MTASFSLDALFLGHRETFPDFDIELLTILLVPADNGLQTRFTVITIFTIIIALLEPLLSIFQALHPPQLPLVMCGYRVHLCGVVSLLLGTRRGLRPVEVLAQKLELVPLTLFGQGGCIILHLLLRLECCETVIKWISEFDLDCLLYVEFRDLNRRFLVLSRPLLPPSTLSHSSPLLFAPLHPAVPLQAHPRELLVHGHYLPVLLYERVELHLPMRILYLARPTRALVRLLEAPEEVTRRRDEVLRVTGMVI